MASIEKSGFVSISSLAEELGVSGMTIRRDMSLLESKGTLERTHGGAIADGHVGQTAFDEVEPSFENRARRNAIEKLRIARTAAAMVGRRVSIELV